MQGFFPSAELLRSYTDVLIEQGDAMVEALTRKEDTLTIVGGKAVPATMTQQMAMGPHDAAVHVLMEESEVRLEKSHLVRGGQ